MKDKEIFLEETDFSARFGKKLTIERNTTACHYYASAKMVMDNCIFVTVQSFATLSDGCCTPSQRINCPR